MLRWRIRKGDSNIGWYVIVLCAKIEFKGSWEKYLHLVEFSLNNSYQVSIQMTPYEAPYERKCRIPLCWTELNEVKIVGQKWSMKQKEKVRLVDHYLTSLKGWSLAPQTGTSSQSVVVQPCHWGCDMGYQWGDCKKYLIS